MSLFKKNETVEGKYIKNQEYILEQLKELQDTVKNLENLLSKETSAHSIITKDSSGKKKGKRGPKTKFSNRKDIAEYYLSHTLSETTTRYNVSGPTVSAAFVNRYGATKRQATSANSDDNPYAPATNLLIDADN